MFKNISKEELVVPAAMTHLLEVRNFIESIGKKYKFSDKIINSFKLVVDESCTNIIRHGYSNVKDGKITIRAIIRRLSLTVIIIDQGKSFDPRQVRDPDLNKYVQIGKKGGLGIFMMRKLMDDIQYNLTGNGNELRLTKNREGVEEPKLISWFDALSLRGKFFVITFAILMLLSIGTYLILAPQIESGARTALMKEAVARASEFSKTNWEPLHNLNDILLYENAKSFQESRDEMVRHAVILNNNKEVIAIYPIDRSLASNEVDLSNLEKIDASPFRPANTEVDSVKIYLASQSDSVFYYFVSPIQLVGDQPIGYALLRVDDAYVEAKASAEKRKWMVFLLLILVGGSAAIVLLVTRITKPFLKLGEWVRQVARGQVDQDEIDIDARDEIGEIAQAFNEVTSKFREAQQSMIEQQRLQKELQVAQEIQQMLLPDDFPDVVGYDITSYYQAAKEVGGDLFDFMQVDENSIGICVADVSGKGIPGSLVMTMIRTSLRLETRGNNNPAEILAKVNSFVTDDIRKGMFVTMYYVILDSRERVVSFASAGHNPMILYRGKSKQTYYLNPSGFPVGITLPDIKLFSERIMADRIRLHPDDILVLYTDGVTEAMNPQRELYGEERFLAAIRKYGHLDVIEFVKSVKEDILNFTGGFEQNDDITLVAIKENMAAVDVKVNLFKQLFETVQANNDVTVADACRDIGISPTTFYRYKRLFQEGGYDLLREMLHGYTNLGLRHLSIEVKTKIYDIIRESPELGPKKISDLLNTEKYGFTEISPLLVYEELKRAKLNTKERRDAFIQRGGKRRLKPPGTPLLTLDGEVLVGFRSDDQPRPDLPFLPSVPPQRSKSREKIISAKGKRLPGLQDINEENETDENSQEDFIIPEEDEAINTDVTIPEDNQGENNP